MTRSNRHPPCLSLVISNNIPSLRPTFIPFLHDLESWLLSVFIAGNPSSRRQIEKRTIDNAKSWRILLSCSFEVEYVLSVHCYEKKLARRPFPSSVRGNGDVQFGAWFCNEKITIGHEVNKESRIQLYLVGAFGTCEAMEIEIQEESVFEKRFEAAMSGERKCRNAKKRYRETWLVSLVENIQYEYDRIFTDFLPEKCCSLHDHSLSIRVRNPKISLREIFDSPSTGAMQPHRCTLGNDDHNFQILSTGSSGICVCLHTLDNDRVGRWRPCFKVTFDGLGSLPPGRRQHTDSKPWVPQSPSTIAYAATPSGS